MNIEPEVWLRGPIAGVPAALMPAAHAFLQTMEDAERAAADLSIEQLWQTPAGSASVGFHLLHLAGSTDRLLTYARGLRLSSAQQAALAAEQAPERRPATDLIQELRGAIEAAVAQLRATDPATLFEPRPVGRAALPSTVLGLLFHAAEHSQRHAGQVVTTARLVRGGRS
jgi:uncharacterized damage-inducible protein DinB